MTSIPTPVQLCSVTDCSRPVKVKSRGWCWTHYKKWQRHGDPLGQSYPGPEATLWAQVERRAEGDCWPWRGSPHPGGRGKVKVHGRYISAPRYAFMLTHGEPVGQVLHRYGNGHIGCCNSAHLYDGSHVQNMDDGDKHETTAKGERNGNSKLTEDEVREIRRLPGTSTEMAAKYGISTAMVSFIRRHLNWKHVR